MGALFTALVVMVPIAELIVFAVVADAIGVLRTVLLLVVISVMGAILLVRQGAGTWRRLRETMRRHEMPTDDLADAALIAVAGVLFLTPGFFTDAVAFLVVIPPTRIALRRSLRRAVAAVAATRFGRRGRAAVAGKKVYDVKVTERSTRRGSGPSDHPAHLPSSGRLSDEDDSPGTG